MHMHKFDKFSFATSSPPCFHKTSFQVAVFEWLLRRQKCFFVFFKNTFKNLPIRNHKVDQADLCIHDCDSSQ